MAHKKLYKKSNFGGAFLFVNKERAHALSVLYNFCRLADDIVDEDPQNAPARLAGLRTELDNIFNDKPQTELGSQIHKILKTFPIPHLYFSQLIDGVEKDLKTPVRYATFGDLKGYMYRVAGVVGLMCIEIFGYHDQETKTYAKDLGHAVQLTNIIRDVSEDAAINRIYLPKKDMEKFGVSEGDILEAKNSRRVRALLMYEIERAQTYYALAKKSLHTADFTSMLPARAMDNLYEELLKKIKTRGPQLGAPKIRLSRLEKFKILLKTWKEKP